MADDAGFWVELKRLDHYCTEVPVPGIPAVTFTHTHERSTFTLRIAPDPERDMLLPNRSAQVRCGFEDWQRTQDLRTEDTGLAPLHAVALPTAALPVDARIDFTWRWTDGDGAWAGKTGARWSSKAERRARRYAARTVRDAQRVLRN